VALELDRDEMNQERLEELGYQVFTTVTALRSYASQRVDGEGDGAGPTLLPASSGNSTVSAPVEDDGIAVEPVPDTAALTAMFHQEMVSVYERAQREVGYNATVFLRMVSERGGLGAARYLLDAAGTSAGFAALFERGRLDLTVEAVVLQERWRKLFNESQLDRARDRLTQLGFEVPLY
jgi:hypothetical protein